MKFDNTSIATEMRTIINSGPKKVHGYYYSKLYIKGKVFTPHKIANIDVFGDYLNNFCDEVLVDLYLSPGMYENDIIPNKENIEIKIFRRVMTEDSETEDLTDGVRVIEGRLVLTDKNNQFFANSTSANKKETRDKLGVQKVTFQIVNPILEAFRMQSTGGIFRLATGIDVIRTILLNVTNSNNVDESYKIKGVDIAPNFNNEVKTHINIPHGTKVLDVPDYINKNVEGIYAAGLGFYLKKDIWYIYPTYDVDRFNNATKTLTVLRVPTDVLPVMDRTFLANGNNVTIIVNKTASLIDGSDIEQQNLGNGLRFTDARNVMEDFVKIDGNKATASRGKNVSEFVMEQRETKLNNIVSPGSKISSNMFYEMSNLAKRNGSVVDVLWEYSDASLLYPGMPVRFMSQQGDGVAVVYGVLLASHETIMLEGKGITTNKHKTSCNLSIFVKRKIKWNEENVDTVDV